MSTTCNSKVIRASRQILYEAFTSPRALETWMAPGDMTGKIHHFDLKEEGSYEMSLFYPESEQGARGKTAGKEDRYTARFVELRPGERIVEAIRFDSADAHFQGEMIMEVTFEPVEGGTRVTMSFNNIPEGIDPKDNEKGTELSLRKLEEYVNRL